MAHPTATPRRRQEEGGLRSSDGNGGGEVQSKAPWPPDEVCQGEVTRDDKLGRSN